MLSPRLYLLVLCFSTAARLAPAAPPSTEKPTWKYSAELLEPIWQGTTMHAEPVLFIKDEKGGQPRAAVLFPIEKIIRVQNSAGDVTFENGRDYIYGPGSREIMLPAGSRIPSRTAAELRRPAGSQPYALTHRDGNGEILFANKLEYADMQTCITYSHAPDLWKGETPKFAGQTLPRTVEQLKNKRPLKIVVLGDSISSGGNASGAMGGPPYQPAYPELVKQCLEAHYHGKVDLKNLSVGGMATDWAVSMTDHVAKEKPDLVIIAFGMNDAGGRSPEEYTANTRSVIEKVRQKCPDTEFILVATMLGNTDWTYLNADLFPKYRDGLKSLCGPGIALADLTSVWQTLLEGKQYADQTGNGVNHPNDFGHRVYAQAVCGLLIKQ